MSVSSAQSIEARKVVNDSECHIITIVLKKQKNKIKNKKQKTVKNTVYTFPSHVSLMI